MQLFKKKNNTKWWKSGLKISSKNKINFLEQLWNLLQAWIPVLNSLKIIMYQTKDKKFNKMLISVIDRLNKWETISTALSFYPNSFNTFDISILEMWEITWSLAESIDTIKTKEEKSKELKWKIIWALIYPIVVITLSIIMVCVFMVYVIPKIEVMYEDSKVNLPTLTQTVINISKFMQENIVLIAIWALIFGVLVYAFKTWKVTKIYWDSFILRIPFFGMLIKRKILALFTSSLWMLLNSWIIITKALEITSKALENDYYEKEIKNINSRVAKWIELSTLMWIDEIQNKKENFFFPIELASVVKIWEETWNLPKMLQNISEKMNKEIDIVIKNMQTAIEPTVIIIVWVVVGTLIMAIMLPFFNMVNVI